MGNFYSVGENEALVIWYREGFFSTGTHCQRTVVGPRWTWVWWWGTEIQRLSLEVMTVNPVCKNVLTEKDIPISVTGVAQVKIMSDNKDYLANAIEKFLGKPVEEIKKPILDEFQGHLRAIVGTFTVEQCHENQEDLAALTREVASRDLARMGIEILTFYIEDVFDDEGSKTEIAGV